MTEGSFSPLLSSFLHFCFCRSHSQFLSPFSHSPIPADFFTSCLPLFLFSNTCLCKHWTLNTRTPTCAHRLNDILSLFAVKEKFLQMFQSFLFNVSTYFLTVSHYWNAMKPCLSTSPPSCESSPFWEVALHVMDGGQIWVSRLEKLYLIWSMSPSCIVQDGLLYFFKVPSCLLTSARLLISLFYLPLTTRHRLPAHESIVEDWEGECLPWPPLPQSLSLSHPPHHTYIHTHTYRKTHMHKMNDSLCPLYPHLWSQLQFWLILKCCKVRAWLCVYLVLADAVR